MNANQLLPSRFLKQADVEDEPTWTIRTLDECNVAPEDKAPEMKWTLKFFENEKPLILNKVNTQILMKCLGSETDDWTGKQIALYVDQSVSFGGQVTGGIRLRCVKRPRNRAPQPAPAPRTEAATVEELTDDIPL